MAGFNALEQGRIARGEEGIQSKKLMRAIKGIYLERDMNWRHTTASGGTCKEETQGPSTACVGSLRSPTHSARD